MTATPTAEGFVATTRRGVAWDFVGGVEGLLGPLFLPKLFPEGVILTWKSPAPGAGDASGAGGRAATGYLGAGSYKGAGVTTTMKTLEGPIELAAPDGRKVAVMRLEPDPSPGLPMADYPALVDRMERAFAMRLYDRGMADSGQVRGYLRRMRACARDARDDVEFVFAAVVAGRSYVKFSLPLVFKEADLHSSALAEGWNAEDLATISVSWDEGTRVATVRVEAFLDAADVDRAFEKALSHHPAGIVVDLYNCPGVTLASLRALSWVADGDLDAGVFFGPEARPGILKGRLMNPPLMDLDSAAAVGAIESELDRGGAVRVRVRPVERPFSGPVALVVSKRTTTSAEPLALLLKSGGRARLFGERTAGRPLLSRPADIGQGWVLWLAAADYRGPGGESLSGSGVRPDESLSKSAARRAAAEWAGRGATAQHQ
jgi:hypothetical protein